MSQTPVPITQGTGATSVAAELVGGTSYQQIEVYGGGGASVLSVNPDGSLKASIIGTPTVSLSGSPSISGAVTVIGSPSISGTVNIGNAPSVYGNFSGSVASFPQGTIITSLVSTVPSSVIVGASIFGLPPVNVTNTNLNVAGSVVAFQGGGWTTSLVSTVPSSVLVGASITGGTITVASVLNAVTVGFGGTTGNGVDSNTLVTLQQGNSGGTVNATLPVGNYVFNGNSWDRARGNSVIGALVSTGASSVISLSQGSVATAQTGTWIVSVVSTVPSSVLVGASIFGTVPVTQSGTNITSISGSPTVTISSIATANGGLTLNAPFGSWIQGTADFRGNAGASITVLAAQGTSVFTYVTGAQLANMGSASVLVTFAGGLGSILGYTIAPAGGGSNIVYPNGLKTGANSAFTASISGQASVLLSLQGFSSGT